MERPATAIFESDDDDGVLKVTKGEEIVWCRF